MTPKKTLFVCRANVIRSQMAAAFYNQLTGEHLADSAGTDVDAPGQTLGQRSEQRPAAKLVIKAMLTRGIDLSDSKRSQLTPEMLIRYDRVVNMADEKYIPTWLATADNYVRWHIDDPMAIGLERTGATRDLIEAKVKDLISS